MIGKRIGGRYEILRGIGEGGMSKVYLAHDVILDRDVAIKVLDYDFANEDDLKRRFQREALSATSLTHPHIVNIFDVGEEGELHYLVMEYIEGQTLKRYIQTNGPLPPEQAVPIMLQLVSAIANAHHNGIIHRDIKPQNILMDGSGNVKITDFGIAMALDSTAHTKTNSVIGTVHYLSPEQARGGIATKKSDIYSLGIVFYELLTGEPPFSAETAVAIALKHLQEETPSVRDKNPAIPQSIENVILRATAKDALNRYRNADEMYEDLLTVLSPERAAEPKYFEPVDEDKTRIIPAVNEASKFDNVEETKPIIPVEPPAVEPPLKKKRKKWPIVAGILGGLLALILLALLLPSLLGPKKAAVPDIVGKEKQEAVSILSDKGFDNVEQVDEVSDDVEAGYVIRMMPESGRKREVDTKITIYVSSGKEMVEMQNYAGQDIDRVAALLENRGFSIRQEKQHSDKTAGTILDQSPAAGEMVVPEETELVFTVSAGPQLITLKNLSGYSEAELDAYANETKLLIRATYEESDEVEKGKVIRQSPQAGAELAKSDTVDVVVSQGPKKKPSKLSVYQVVIPYEQADSDENVEDGDGEEGEGQPPVPQHVRIYVKDKSHSMNDIYDEFDITETVKHEVKIELEEGQTGGYRIVRDSEIIEEKTISYDD